MAEQVLVTGITGFIAKHVALELLKAGFAVRGTVRSQARATRTRASLAAAGADVARLSFVEADLSRDAGWAEAAAGCRYVQHIASPFPIEAPRDGEALIRLAREGTLRALRAGFDAGAERVVLTSSTAAMMYRADRPPVVPLREHDWTDPSWPLCSAYTISKMRAEEAAWAYADERGARSRLVTVNPSLVLGPPLDGDIGASLQIVRLMLERRYPALPPLAIPVVDVRDVARLHVVAMTTPAAGGRRLLAAADSPTMREMALYLKHGLGAAAQRVPTAELPAFVVRLGALFDRRLQSALANLGVKPVADTGYVTALTGVTFRPAREATVAAGEALIRLGVAKV